MSEEIKALKDELELYKMMHRHLSVENKKILKILFEVYILLKTNSK